jgi:hypothetical protein
MCGWPRTERSGKRLHNKVMGKTPLLLSFRFQRRVLAMEVRSVLVSPG